MTELNTVATTLTLNLDDAAALDQTQLRLNLARLYKVPVELISIEVNTGSVVINVYIAEGDSPTLSIGSLLAVVSSQADALPQALGLENVNVSATPPVLVPRNVTTNETVTTVVVTDCPAGSW